MPLILIIYRKSHLFQSAKQNLHYCYRLVNIITYEFSQIDHIKWHLVKSPFLNTRILFKEKTK
jgi:hypothetical protein